MITVSRESPLGPAEQIRSQLEALIRAGALAADARLPSVRQLSADLRVAPGTVARAYKELEDAGLVRAARAAGTRVNPGYDAGALGWVEADRLVRAARGQGLGLAEVQGLVAAAWAAQEADHRPAGGS
ncbi:GntR family transcriptional regulator [Zhihengliuella flava]|uniref:DNA-binding transcriptional regulator YhcF (GntR family) n=1 Tax=Zhihengliuella flava TaxID=1285193 RepID=A0A931D9V4_9MICC|nr:GntR family transcriptional regulator [Zhihengliuella flava]MBG6085102.1 DNA-binding transcriptional regulator YhcF (GntR family) [Zhihengliuella flava]